MCKILQVYSLVVAVMSHLVFRVVQEYMCMEENHKEFYLSHTLHVLVWYQNARDKYDLTRVQHVVCCADQKIAIQETGLSHNTSSRLDARHLYYVAHDTPCLSTFFYFAFFVFYVI